MERVLSSCFPIVVATKNIVPFDFVDFFAPAIVRSEHENYYPPRPVHGELRVCTMKPAVFQSCNP